MKSYTGGFFPIVLFYKKNLKKQRSKQANKKKIEPPLKRQTETSSCEATLTFFGEPLFDLLDFRFMEATFSFISEAKI